MEETALVTLSHVSMHFFNEDGVLPVLKDITFSPIKGPEGNIEYLIHIEKNPAENERTAEYTESIVESMLQEQMEQNTGFGREEANLQIIKETVERAHQSL